MMAEGTVGSPTYFSTMNYHCTVNEWREGNKNIFKKWRDGNEFSIE
jgi:hypothetical protein